MTYNSSLQLEKIDLWADEIQNKAYQSAFVAATEARTILYNVLSHYIDQYYDEYDPTFYKRTYAFRDKSHKGFVNKRANKWVKGGVKVSAESIPSNNYTDSFYYDDDLNGIAVADADPWEVTESNMQGYHGHAFIGESIDLNMQHFLQTDKLFSKKIERTFIKDFLNRIQ